MVNMNIQWGEPASLILLNAAGYQRHAPQPESKSFLGGLFTLNARQGEEQRPRGHTHHSTSSRSTPRRANTVTVLPAGVKMPTGDQPEVSYGADGAKYLVIPRRSNSSSRPRQIIVTHSPSPRRQNSSTSTTRIETRSPPHRSNSSSQRPMSPPRDRAPKIIGDPELVKQYENSQRNVARWVESVGDSASGQTRRSTKRTVTR